jgi:hypothetical protein
MVALFSFPVVHDDHVASTTGIRGAQPSKHRQEKYGNSASNEAKARGERWWEFGLEVT